MQTVSTAWKNNQTKTIVNESFVEVSLDIADPDALADASSQDNGAVYISDTSQVVSEVDKNIIPYSTLEQNLWILDGSRKTLPVSDFGDCGFVGDVLSDANCGFTDKTPVITVNFTQVHRNLIPAITITWGKVYNEFAEDFIVTAYNGDTIVAEKEVLGNKTVKTVVTMDVVNYDRITITILRWCLPCRRARVEEIFVGMNKVYSKSDLFDYTHAQTVDPISTSLPKAEVSFLVDNTDNSYNPHNANGLSKYLMKRQEIKTRYGYKLDDNRVEWIKGGTFYLSEWSAAQNGMKAEFTARDLLEFMSSTFYEGLYNENGTSLYALATQLLLKANLPLNDDGTVKWHLDSSLQNIYTVAPLPVDTLANNLQMIANAGGCVFYQDRNGTLHIEPVNTVTSDYSITLKNSYSRSDITLSKPLKQVNVAAYQYFEDVKPTELYKGVLPLTGTTELWIVYSEKAKTASASVTNGTLVSAEYYTNACKLTITAEGNATVLIEGTVLKTSKTDVITESDVAGETISLDNPLITSRDRAVAIGAWMEQYLRNRMTLKSYWRSDPRLDALDVVSNHNEYNTNDVIMTKVAYDYKGAFHGNGEGRVI